MPSHSSAPDLSRTWKILHIAGGIIVILAIGAVDYYTNPEVILTLFYLVPIALASWFVFWQAGWLIGILSAVISTVSNELPMGYFASKPLLTLWAFFSRLVFFLLVASILARLKQTLAHSRELSLTDDLTQALNTRAFFEILEKELQRSHRYGRPLTVVYLDLDNFKAVNDSLGHQAGDTVLQTVVRIMQTSVRDPDSVARLGGDEFAILLPETNLESSKALLPRINDSLLDAMRQAGWPVTFSIGALTCSQSICSSDEIFRRVDTLMYSVKHAGKNGIRFEVIAD
jgi:diguanylate cyclase (GGDEF)-like protein